MTISLENKIEDVQEFNFENFYDEYNPYVINVVHKLMRDISLSESAEDIVNISWLKLLKKIKINPS